MYKNYSIIISNSYRGEIDMRKSKILSLILCVCLLVSSLSVFAHAIDIEIDLSDLFKPSTDGGSETLPPENDDDEGGNDNTGKKPSGVGTIDKTSGDKDDKKEEEKKEETVPEVVYNSDFSDVTEDKWFYSYVKNLASKGIVEGYEDGTFQPQKNVTRAEFIKLLVVSMGYQQSSMPSFDDVAQKDWYYTYVSTAVKNGVLSKEDYGANLRPNEVISREEAAKLLVKAAKLETGKYKTPYEDSDDEYVVALYTICLMQGELDAQSGKRYFKPESGITRAETSTVFSRLLEYNEDPAKFVEEKMEEYGLEELKVLMTDTNSFNNAIYGIGVSPMSFYLYRLDKKTSHEDFSNSFYSSYEQAFSHLPQHFTFTDLVIEKEESSDGTDVTVSLSSTSDKYSIEDLLDMRLHAYARGEEITSSLLSDISLSPIEKLEKIYTYITQNISYPTQENPDDIYYLPISVFSNKTGTCQAIASAFNIMCRSAGFDVCAVSLNNHVFNCVILDGEYLFFDCTHEITSQKFYETVTDTVPLNCFALSQEKMQNIHGNFSLPLAFWCTLE